MLLFLYDNDETREILEISSNLFWKDSLKNIDIIWLMSDFANVRSFNIAKLWLEWVQKSHWHIKSKTIFASFWIKRKLATELLQSNKINVRSYKVTNELSSLNKWLNSKN